MVETMVNAAVPMVAVQQAAERVADVVALMAVASLVTAAASKEVHKVVAMTEANLGVVVALAREAGLVATGAA